MLFDQLCAVFLLVRLAHLIDPSECCVRWEILAIKALAFLDDLVLMIMPF